MNTDNSPSVSIDTGAGNDSIYNYGVGNVYVYKSGECNDVIYGFDEDDTFLIEGNSWSKTTVDSDIVLTVDNGKITLADATTLPSINVTSSTKDIHPVNLVEN